MVSDELHLIYRRSWWALVVRGLISLALGVLILVRPMESAAAFALVIAIWALVSGITQIVHSFEVRGAVSHWWLLLVSGIISVAFGVAALYYYPLLSLTFAVVWTSYWLLASGFLTIYLGIMERRVGLPWGWTMAFGILAVVGGIYAIAVPPVTLAVIMGLVAGFALVGGVALLFAAYKLRSARIPIIGSARSAAQA